MTTHDPDEIKRAVRERYGSHATRGTSCCGSAATASGGSSCCGGPAPTLRDISQSLGYDGAALQEIPAGADLGLGCGNPLALLEIKSGETVLDLGSGGGIDCFLAAKRVGPSGRVIGVDMTPEMLDRARRNAAEAGFDNVEFRLGEIEHLPVADATVDVIISNCVVNLVPDKAAVFADAFRVLKPGGRLSISDMVLLGEIPIALRDSVDAYVACLSGAILKDDYLALLAEAGFTDIEVTSENWLTNVDDVLTQEVIEKYRKRDGSTDEELRAAASRFASICVRARKPE